MKMKMKKLASVFATAAAAALLASAAPAEDLTVVYRTSGQGGSGTSTQYFSSDRMRVSSGESDLIYEFSKGRMVNVDHKRKEYSEISLAELEAAMTAASGEMEKLSAQLDGMPAGMREKMQKMMGGGGGRVTLTKGGTRKIAGYTTREYVITRGDSMKMRVWATSQLQPPVSLADVARMTSASGPMAAMAKNPMFKGMADMVDKMKEVQGFPLADSNTFTIMGRTMKTSREATEVKQGAIPAATFDLAAIAPGYKKIKHPLSKMGRR